MDINFIKSQLNPHARDISPREESVSDLREPLRLDDVVNFQMILKHILKLEKAREGFSHECKTYRDLTRNLRWLRALVVSLQTYNDFVVNSSL